ncbi:bifunctional protein FolD 4, chloroplastic-like [Lotus japonicus]|uniref:bifunctional protein FolD 4, chloroplastic-like n=1 Tax=Lotus japonicus TaxID=34305 RepID=UPI00258FA538|nr:bifunctional protein FolD 4, chloroplastic-like [Lotus japonicus]
MSSSIFNCHSSPFTATIRLSRPSPCFLGLHSSPSSHVEFGTFFLISAFFLILPQWISLKCLTCGFIISSSIYVHTAAMTTKASAKVMDGNAVATQIRQDIKAEVHRMKEAIGVIPGLAAILVGDRERCATYIVQNKKSACETVGINFLEIHLPEYSTENQVLKYISILNDDPSVHGTIVQIPYNQHMQEKNFLKAVRIEKDVVGLHPFNIFSLRVAPSVAEPMFVPCTALGCIELLHIQCSYLWQRAVVIGGKRIVGFPAAHLLQREGASVSVVDSKTSNLKEITRQADIVISAAAQPNLVRRSWIKDGAVIIDVGFSPEEDPNSPGVIRWVGDVCYEEAIEVASAMTSVRGGVGSMTMAMLLQNTLLSAKRMHNFE